MRDINFVELFMTEAKCNARLGVKDINSEKEILRLSVKNLKHYASYSTQAAAFAYGFAAFQLQQELFELGEAEEVLDRTEIDFARKETEGVSHRVALSSGKPFSETEILEDTMFRLQADCLSMEREGAFAHGYAAAEAVQELEKLEQSSDESLEKLPDERETRAGNILGPKISMY